MNAVTTDHFRKHFESEVERVIINHDVLRVTRPQGDDFVVLSADDWRAIEETVYLNRVPGLAESILQAAEEPLEEGIRREDLDW
ncbi:MAG: type II toxin-antitoxin system Phd/YefM family antitoxin [bacterium]|nr:type II toxin-antitoxin system Phd/YefM family antitoxin [bacterium]